MKLSSAFLAFFICFLASFHVSVSLERREIVNRDQTPRKWMILGESHPEYPIKFVIHLKRENTELIDKIFEDVSNPASKRWRQFLTKSQIEKIIRPSQEIFDQFEAWFRSFGDVGKVVYGVDKIFVQTSVKKARELFHVPFHYFQHENGKILIRCKGSASIPTYLKNHVDLITGLSEFFDSKFETSKSRGVRRTAQLKDNGPKVTPDLLKNYYNVPKNAKGKNQTNYQGIAAFDDFFSMGALRQFEKHFQLPQSDIKVIGESCLPNCDQFESDLDVQYMTALAQNIRTLFLVQPEEYWVLQFTDDALNEDVVPYVFSISYGWSELEQCAIGTKQCNKLGYDSQKYVDRTNTNFKLLGLRGVSIFVSDGDDGAASLGAATGNCPIDPQTYCPVGGCAHTSSKCPAITIIEQSTQKKCFFPMGIGSDACQDVLQDTYAVNTALGKFLSNQGSCEAYLEQDAESNYHVYSSCACSDLQAAQASGYRIEPYTYEPKNGALFVADYPTSSPFVTSVGATQFIYQGGSLNETTASIETGSIITTGGGFSSFQAMPSYQSQAVQQWLNSSAEKPPSYSFNTSMRAYPDISFCGHNYQIFYSDSDKCPCHLSSVDGTSASSPAIAGLVSLLNDELLQKGQKPLGFLNPLLYKMHAEDPSAFNDITTGNNKCNRAYCCQYGYEASEGWDPATGLGTPNFKQMLSYILRKI